MIFPTWVMLSGDGVKTEREKALKLETTFLGHVSGVELPYGVMYLSSLSVWSLFWKIPSPSLCQDSSIFSNHQIFFQTTKPLLWWFEDFTELASRACDQVMGHVTAQPARWLSAHVWKAETHEAFYARC